MIHATYVECLSVISATCTTSTMEWTQSTWLRWRTRGYPTYWPGSALGQTRPGTLSWQSSLAVLSSSQMKWGKNISSQSRNPSVSAAGGKDTVSYMEPDWSLFRARKDKQLNCLIKQRVWGKGGGGREGERERMTKNVCMFGWVSRVLCRVLWAWIFSLDNWLSWV